MTKKSLFPAILLAFLFLTTIPAMAAFEYQMDLTSRYVWRGFDLNPLNKPALQPSLTYGFGESGFAVNLWGSFSFEDKQMNETDISFSYDFKINEKISMSVGFTHYGWYFTDNFDFGENTSQEFYISASMPGPIIDTALSLYYDFTNGDGLYILLKSSKSVKLSDKMNVDLGASIGYNSDQWIDKSGFSDIVLNISAPYKVEKLTITPFMNLAFILLDEINPSDTELWFGISIAF